MSGIRPSAKGLLPNGWARARFSELFCRITTRNRGQSDNVLTASAVSGLVSQEEFFNRRVASKDLGAYTLLKRGDFAYNKSYSDGFPVGVVRRLESYEYGVLSPLYICFRLTAKCCDGGFLSWLLKSGAVDDQLAFIAKEGARNHGLLNVGVSDFFDIELTYPPLAEQQRIAEILDTVDEAIRKTEEVIAKLQQMKQGLLHDLLTRGIDDNGEIRDPDRHPEQFKDSALGRIPRAWECKPLASLVHLQVGYAFKSEWFSEHQGCRLLRGENVGYGCPDWSETRRLFGRPAGEFEEYMLAVGDVIIGMDRTFTKSGVKVSVIGKDDVPALLVQRVGRFVPFATVDVGFVLQILSWPLFHRELLAQQKGMDIPHLSRSEILAPIVPVPERAEQEKIAERLVGVDGRVERESLQLVKLRHLKSALMDDLLTGRVRTTPPEPTP